MSPADDSSSLSAHQRHLSDAAVEQILDSTPAVLYIKSLDGRYLIVNRSFEQLLDCRRDEICGKTDAEIFPPEVATALMANDQQVTQTRQAHHFDESVPGPLGVRQYMSVKFPLIDEQGNAYAVCGISSDITDRIESEQRLRQEQRFLSNALRVHERERQLLAYEIHDGLVQDITAATMYLEDVRRHLPGLLAREKLTEFDESLQLLRHSVAEARRVMSGLRPPILDEEGIVMAIDYLLAEQAASGELEISFSHDVEFDRLNPLLEGTVFRIVQEAVTNIKRHSQARQAIVRLSQHGQMLRILVQDSGVGFNPQQVPESRFGLSGIRKRAALVGGRAEINSAPGDGTRIIVELPLEVADEPAG